MPSYRSDGTERTDTFSTVLDSIIFLTKSFRSVAELYAGKVFKLLDGDTLDIETVWYEWKSGTSCSKLVRETSSQILGNNGFFDA